MVPTPNNSNILSALRSFLLGVLPSGLEVIEGQDNRVAEPVGLDFVVMTPIRRARIETNLHAYADCSFTASIAGTLMTVSAVAFGTIGIGAQVFTLNGTLTVVSQTTGSAGGAGIYTMSGTLSLASSKCAAGTIIFTQPTEVTVQLDVHGPNSADNAEVITTLFRDDFAVQSLLASGFAVTPLYADDARQIPYINDQQQYENRWIIEAVMQADQAVSAPQQFADVLVVIPISVDAAYPP